MCKRCFNQPKGEGERIALQLKGVGLTFAPSEWEEMENNLNYSVEHVGEYCGEEPKYVQYEEIMDRKPHPDESDAGKHRKILLGANKMTMIVPDLTDGLHQEQFYSRKLVSVHEQQIISRPKYDFSVILVKGYMKHLTCSFYIQEVKKQVIGKLVKLRTPIMKTSVFYAQRFRYIPETYTSQYRFASENMLQLVVLGMNDFEELPLDVMNKMNLLTYMKSVKTEELAELVKKVATTKTVQVKVRDFPERKNFFIECVFDNDEKLTYCFGKGPIKMFENLVQEMDENGLAPFTILCSAYENEMIARKKRQKLGEKERKLWKELNDISDGESDGNDEDGEMKYLISLYEEGVRKNNLQKNPV